VRRPVSVARRSERVRPELRFPADRVGISAMAGVPVKTLQRLVAPATDVARVIPLPSVARRDGITPVHPPNAAAAALFDRLGETVERRRTGGRSHYSTSNRPTGV
jgi:pyrroline-5-carboxylate reductase